MKTNRRKQVLAAQGVVGIAALAILAGCNRSPYELAPVHGVVTVDDKPLFQGKVQFSPIAKGEELNPGKPAYGKIDEDGNYRLTTFEPNDGAVIGEHWASVINVEEELPDGVPEFWRVAAPDPVSVVPGKDNRIDIKLTREVVRAHREDDT